jgi:hypothetical protein
VASKADSRLDGDASAPRSPRGTGDLRQLSGFSPRRDERLPGLASELGNHLRPDRDHPDEQRDRRQRRRLFHEYLQHARLLEWEHMKNIVPFLF